MEELKLMYDACCRAIGNDLGTKVRNNELAYARFVYFHNAKKMFPTISNQKIGSIAGGRDNATVIHGIKRYGELKGYSDFDAIRKKIEWEIDKTTPKGNKTETRQEREIRYLYANKARLEKQLEILSKRIDNSEVEKDILNLFNSVPKDKLNDFKETRLKPYLKLNAL